MMHLSSTHLSPIVQPTMLYPSPKRLHQNPSKASFGLFKKENFFLDIASTKATKTIGIISVTITGLMHLYDRFLDASPDYSVFNLIDTLGGLVILLMIGQYESDKKRGFPSNKSQ